MDELHRGYDNFTPLEHEDYKLERIAQKPVKQSESAGVLLWLT
jgi:hypothetical protein